MKTNDIAEPSLNGANGRNTDGRFLPGNKLGRDNPHAKKISQLRAAMIKSITAKDIAAIVEKMTERAKSGDMAAIRELLDRTLGRPLQADIIERIEALESLL